VVLGQKLRLKAQAQPIWILIGLLLAMIIGIMMYQLVGGALQQGTYDQMVGDIDMDTAKMQLTTKCSSWKKSSWAIPPTDMQLLADYAAKLNILSKSEWDRRELFSSCDCSMYLYVNKLISRSEVEEVYDEDYCHDWANQQAESFGIGQ
jgi:hypothetical protein